MKRSFADVAWWPYVVIMIIAPVRLQWTKPNVSTATVMGAMSEDRVLPEMVDHCSPADVRCHQ